MNGLRSLDIFQKISVDNITKPTLVGSVLSLSAIAIIFFLVIKEIFDLFTPALIRNSDVVQDQNIHSKINVNFSIRIPNIPCNLISVDQEDSVGNHRMDISDTLTKDYIEADGTISNYNKHSNTIQNIYDAIAKGRGCKVEGYIPISKVPGDIHISFHNYGIYYMQLKSERKDLFDKISFNHRITSLTFGDVANDQKLLLRFGYGKSYFSSGKQVENSFSQNTNLPNFEGEKFRKNYDYYVKLIPHYFRDETRGRFDTGYQFSMTSKSRDFFAEEDNMPIIIINYDFSPISMVLLLQNKSLFHFLTHICAIVGGVYVIFSIVNRTLVSLLDSKE